MKHKQTAASLGAGLARGIFPLLAALLFLALTEWVARGELTAETFAEYIRPHYKAYLLSWLLLVLIWAVVDAVTRLAPLATLAAGCAGLIPAAVNFYTLQLRGEPFLPWDLTQVEEAAGVAAAAGLKVQPSMVWSGCALLALTALSFFLYRRRGRLGLPPGSRTLPATLPLRRIAVGLPLRRRSVFVLITAGGHAFAPTRAVAAPVEELHALGLDLGGVAVLPVLVLPFAGLQAAFHIHEAALGEIIGAVLRLTLENGNAVPFGALHLVAVTVHIGLVRGDIQAGDGRTGLGVAQFGVAPQTADDHDFIEHGDNLERLAAQLAASRGEQLGDQSLSLRPKMAQRLRLGCGVAPLP